MSFPPFLDRFYTEIKWFSTASEAAAAYGEPGRGPAVGGISAALQQLAVARLRLTPTPGKQQAASQTGTPSASSGQALWVHDCT